MHVWCLGLQWKEAVGGLGSSLGGCLGLPWGESIPGPC